MYFTQNICVSHITIFPQIIIVSHDAEQACGAPDQALHLIFI